MVREEFDTTLRLLKNGKPFRLFKVAMVNGDCIEVDCPDALAVRDGVAFYIKSGGAPVWIEHESVTHVNC